MMVLLIMGGMILFHGLRRYVLGTCLLAVPGVAALMWCVLMHDYQKQRVLTFLNPGDDPLGAGYHILQSRIAIGSGELWGKGYMEGMMNKLNFLPERHSDFALAVFGEEWGFVGCVALVTPVSYTHLRAGPWTTSTCSKTSASTNLCKCRTARRLFPARPSFFFLLLSRVPL